MFYTLSMHVHKPPKTIKSGKNSKITNTLTKIKKKQKIVEENKKIQK